MLDLLLLVDRLAVDHVIPHATHGRIGNTLWHGGGVARTLGRRELVILVRRRAERLHIAAHVRIESVSEVRNRRGFRRRRMAGARHGGGDESKTEPASDIVHGGRL
jgi:hypothetical protein